MNCIICNSSTDIRCEFCGGQSGKTFICQTHRIELVSKKNICAFSCKKCADKILKRGLWKEKK
jgi:hypothetical protein